MNTLVNGRILFQDQSRVSVMYILR